MIRAKNPAPLQALPVSSCITTKVSKINRSLQRQASFTDQPGAAIIRNDFKVVRPIQIQARNFDSGFAFDPLQRRVTLQGFR